MSRVFNAPPLFFGNISNWAQLTFASRLLVADAKAKLDNTNFLRKAHATGVGVGPGFFEGMRRHSLIRAAKAINGDGAESEHCAARRCGQFAVRPYNMLP